MTYSISQILVVLCVLVPLPLYVSSAGLYYLTYFDFYSLAVSMTLFIALEIIIFVYVLPFEEHKKRILEYTGEKTPIWI